MPEDQKTVWDSLEQGCGELSVVMCVLRMNLSPLEGQPVLLNTEPPAQLNFLNDFTF